MNAIFFENRNLGKYRLLTVRDEASGESFTIIPDYGANVQELVLEKDGRLFSVLDGYQTEADVDANDWSKGNRLIPFPNRIRDGVYTFEGKTYQLPLNEAERHNAIHGFIFKRPFFVERQMLTDDGPAVALSYVYPGDYPGYPFPFEVKLTYTLKKNHAFEVEVWVKNTGNSPMPFGDGWHPYFRLKSPIEQLELKIPSTQILELNEQMIPTGNVHTFAQFADLNPVNGTVLDTVYRLEGKPGVATAELRDPAEKATLRVWQETGPGKYNFMVAFTPPQRESVAIEPMTCSTNAFNSGDGLLVLGPGEIFQARHGVQLV